MPINLPPPPLPPKPQPVQAGGSLTPGDSKPSLLPQPPKPARRAANGGEPFGGGLRVSLMPTEGGEPTADLSRRLAIFVVVIAAELLVIGGVWFWLKVVTDQRTATLAEYERRRGAVEKSYTTQAQDIADARRFDAQVALIDKHLDSHVYWTRFFDFLESNTRPNVSFANFSGDASTGIVSLEANARTYRDIAEQIVLFRKDPMVLDARTTAATTKVDSGGNIIGVGFTVFLHLKPDAWKNTAAAAN